MLEQTECKGCRYFVACTGGCPSEGMNGDFRSKSSHCESYYAMFRCIENILRKIFPGIFLVIDIHNYYEDYFLKHRRINNFARDTYYIDTQGRMTNDFKLLGWTPDDEIRKNQNQKTNSGYSHMDTNTFGGREENPDRKICSCGDKGCKNK